MTRAEAGKLGGQSTAVRYGNDYMRTIGRNGGLLGGRPTWQESIIRHSRKEKVRARKQ